MLLHAFLSALPWTGVVLVIAAVARFAEGDDPGNGYAHESVDEPLDPDPPELLAAA